MKKYITAIILLALLGLGAAGTWITATDVTVQRYMIWLNSGARTAATADSILGFIGGSDTATLIPIPSGGGSGDTSYFDLVGSRITPKTGITLLTADSLAVGQTSASYLLDVKGQAAFGDVSEYTQYIYTRNSSGSASWGVTGTSTVFKGIGSYPYFAYQSASWGPAIHGIYGLTKPQFLPDINKTTTGYGGYGDVLTVHIAGTRKLTIDATGLGIGTTSPSELLHVAGDAYIEDTLAINTTSPDSLLHVAGGAVIETDAHIAGGWQTWRPTFTWTGATGSPTMSQEVYEYNITNNVVRLIINFKVENNTGTTITDMEMTMPITPADNNAYFPLTEYTVISGGTFGRDWGTYVDCRDNTAGNRKLKTGGTVNIPNGEYYQVFIEGFYKIEWK